MPDYNTMELMICTASRELEDGSSVGVGTGAPCAGNAGPEGAFTEFDNFV